jgi:hypothetical protein
LGFVLTVLGVLLSAMGALIVAYPLWKPEDERFGARVRRGASGVEIQQALDKLAERYTPFWTDRKIYIAGAVFIILGTVFVILGFLVDL